MPVVPEGSLNLEEKAAETSTSFQVKELLVK